MRFIIFLILILFTSCEPKFIPEREKFFVLAIYKYDGKYTESYRQCLYIIYSTPHVRGAFEIEAPCGQYQVGDEIIFCTNK